MARGEMRQAGSAAAHATVLQWEDEEIGGAVGPGGGGALFFLFFFPVREVGEGNVRGQI